MQLSGRGVHHRVSRIASRAPLTCTSLSLPALAIETASPSVDTKMWVFKPATSISAQKYGFIKRMNAELFATGRNTEDTKLLTAKQRWLLHY